jgi:glycosyltransferase involved in cell wall biosynthesis
MASGSFSLAYSIADQSFDRTKSLGILNLSLHLAEALAPRREIERFELFSNSSLRNWHRQFAGREVRCFDRASETRLGRMLWDQWQVYGEAAGRRVDWLLLPKGFASFCRTGRVKVATYVHDVINAWYRERYPRAVQRSEAWYFERSLLATLRQSTVVFTNSEFTRQELLTFSERHGVRPPRILVAGIGFRPVGLRPSSNRQHIVALASPWPHKRTDLAARFMSRWQGSTDFVGTVHWVGRWPPGMRRVDEPRWQYHQRLDEQSYRSLLAESRVLVYFSEYEGFGMPPVEAVLHGACPVFSAIPATREVMGGGGAPFENDSNESFADAMSRALRMPADDLASLGDCLLARHNWTAVADRIVGALVSPGAPA